MGAITATFRGTPSGITRWALGQLLGRHRLPWDAGQAQQVQVRPDQNDTVATLLQRLGTHQFKQCRPRIGRGLLLAFKRPQAITLPVVDQNGVAAQWPNGSRPPPPASTGRRRRRRQSAGPRRDRSWQLLPPGRRRSRPRGRHTPARSGCRRTESGVRPHSRPRIRLQPARPRPPTSVSADHGDVAQGGRR